MTCTAEDRHDARERAIAGYRQAYGGGPEFVVRCPGRVNLIGEHTDYNDGHVLPMAIPPSTWIAAGRHAVNEVAVVSEGYAESRFSLGEPLRSGDDWGRYIRAMAWVLRSDGHELAGWRGSVASDIPIGASLSSSAALEIASGRVFLEAAGAHVSPVRLAELAREAESDFVGVPVGIMDQLICSTARAGHATLIDCRDLTMDERPIPEQVRVLVLDTMTRRSLAISAYADRRAACDRAARALGVGSLREVDLPALEAGRASLDPTDYRRALHVIDENARTVAAASALATGDATRLGELMDASHVSLRDLYEVSSEALDLLSAASRGVDGCHGARMTGGGFAGCCVALVESEGCDEIVAEIVSRHRERGGTPPTIHVCAPASGASIERLSSGQV